MPTKSASSKPRDPEAIIRPGKKLPSKAVFNLFQIIDLDNSAQLRDGNTAIPLTPGTTIALRMFTFDGKRLIRVLDAPDGSFNVYINIDGETLELDTYNP